jgi:uncharacterized DUF497 family protein
MRRHILDGPEGHLVYDALQAGLWRGLAGMHKCAYTPKMVEWDPDKATKNLRKHRIDFADAATMLEDENALTIHDDDPDEDRFVTIGSDAIGRILLVIYTWQDNEIRLISARKAEPRERRQYETKK